MARAKKFSIEGLALLPQTFVEYQAVEGVNWSTLKYLLKSPKHYRHNKEQPPEDRQTLMGGRAVHTAILEPDRFPLEYAVFDGPRRAGADWETFKEANAARTILKTTEYLEALAIRDSVRAHKGATKLLSKGTPERTITWKDPGTGLVCKGRIDWLRSDGFVDVKRTANLDPRRFKNLFMDMGYHLQLAWYARGLKALGMAAPRVWLVAVEGDAPYDVGAWEIDPGAIATADVELTRLLELLADCQKRKKWPGRYPEVTTFDMPGWFYDAAAEETGDLGLVITGSTEAA